MTDTVEMIETAVDVLKEAEHQELRDEAVVKYKEIQQKGVDDDEKTIAIWRAFVSDALGMFHPGEDVWLRIPSEEEDNAPDHERNVAHSIIGLWHWDLITFSHSQRGLWGTPTNAPVVNLEEGEGELICFVYEDNKRKCFHMNEETEVPCWGSPGETPV